jgi:hypothetical protein
MANRNIKVEIITRDMMVMAINDTVKAGMVDAAELINNKDLVGGIVVHYFMSQNLFREILGLPLYVMPENENDDEEDEDDE